MAVQESFAHSGDGRDDERTNERTKEDTKIEHPGVGWPLLGPSKTSPPKNKKEKKIQLPEGCTTYVERFSVPLMRDFFPQDSLQLLFLYLHAVKCEQFVYSKCMQLVALTSALISPPTRIWSNIHHLSQRNKHETKLFYF